MRALVFGGLAVLLLVVPQVILGWLASRHWDDEDRYY
jgi:hypothetical protein